MIELLRQWLAALDEANSDLGYQSDLAVLGGCMPFVTPARTLSETNGSGTRRAFLSVGFSDMDARESWAD
jgi:hypothetical protein